MSRHLLCDKCGATGSANLGMRKIAKPAGWSWVMIAVKPEGYGEAPKTTYDLCPSCTVKVVAVLP